MNTLNRKKIITTIIFTILLFGFGELKMAHAALPLVATGIIAGIVGLLGLFGGQLVGGITASAIYYAAYALSYLMGFVASAIFYLGGWLVDFALKINLELLRSPVIETGWKIMLAFTNLGSVLGIIVIAFATIFRLESYALKQTLWKLIVAALLVNFSLVIAGAFIDVSHILTKYFNDRIVGTSGESFITGAGLSAKLADAMKAQAWLSLEEFKETFNESSTSSKSK